MLPAALPATKMEQLDPVASEIQRAGPRPPQRNFIQTPFHDVEREAMDHHPVLHRQHRIFLSQRLVVLRRVQVLIFDVGDVRAVHHSERALPLRIFHTILRNAAIRSRLFETGIFHPPRRG